MTKQWAKSVQTLKGRANPRRRELAWFFRVWVFCHQQWSLSLECANCSFWYIWFCAKVKTDGMRVASSATGLNQGLQFKTHLLELERDQAWHQLQDNLNLTDSSKFPWECFEMFSQSSFVQIWGKTPRWLFRGRGGHFPCDGYDRWEGETVRWWDGEMVRW